MKNIITSSLRFIQKNIVSRWFKLGLLTILAIYFHRKNIQFSLKINTEHTVSTAAIRPLENAIQQPVTMRSMAAKPLQPLSAADRARFKKELAYIDRFVLVAIAEMKKYGIPASITLAQGIVETNSGSSSLARKHHNHFGIKCFSKKCRKGHCVNLSDDTHKDFFVQYGTAWESFRAHSELLNKKRYRHLQTFGKDYKAWANGLSKAGYATDPAYAQKLIQIIEDLKLYRYDTQ